MIFVLKVEYVERQNNKYYFKCLDKFEFTYKFYSTCYKPVGSYIAVNTNHYSFECDDIAFNETIILKEVNYINELKIINNKLTLNNKLIKGYVIKEIINHLMRYGTKEDVNNKIIEYNKLLNYCDAYNGCENYRRIIKDLERLYNLHVKYKLS